MRRIYPWAWVVGIILSAASLQSGAANLGRLEIKSVLGEPLRAEVSISATPAEVASLKAQIASADAYESAGLVHSGVVSQLAVTLKKDTGAEPVLLITSAGPVNEPVLDLLLELSWSSGRVARIYTAFIDPPFIASERARQREERAAAEQAQPAHTQAADVPEAPTPRPLDDEVADESPISEPTQFADEGGEAPQAPQQADAGPVETIGGTGPTLFEAAPSVSAPVASAGEAGDTVKVKRGDTLSKIALANKPDGVTLEQMLVVLFRNNPKAFSGGNMNRLRAGRIIELPDADEYSRVGAAAARKEVRIQSADWNAYRERLAAAATQQPVAQDQPAQQAAGGAVTPKVDEKAAGPSAKPSEVVKLSKGEPGSAAGAGGQGDARALQEKLVASEKALQEQTDRVARLEKIIADLQKLAEVKNQDMAQAQAQAAGAKGATEQPAVQEPAAKPAAEPSAAAGKSKAQTPTATGAQPSPAEPAAGTPASPQTPATAETATAAGTAASASAPATGQPESQPGETPTPATQKPKRRPPPPPPPPPPSLLDQVMEQPYLLAVPLVVLALIGFGVTRLRGRKKREPKAPADESAPAFAATGSHQARGTFSPNDTDVGLASTSRGGGSEEVDPLEEAEIFLAYGRDAQAEELLKEALHTQPRNFEIHAKLAEIYAKRRDGEAFESIARDLQQGTGGSGDLWDRVVALGYSIDPGNPRYAAGSSGQAAAGGRATASNVSTGSGAERLDFDVGLDDDGGGGTAPDFDLSAGSDDEGMGAVFDPDATMDDHQFNMVDAPTMKVRSSDFTATDVDFDIDSPSGESADEGAGDSHTMNFDLDIGGMGGESPATDVSGGSRTDDADAGLDFNIDGISLDSDEVSEPSLGESSDMPALDLSGISLDLDGSAGSQSSSGSGRDEKWYEVQTKFDLAKAYQEMGDKEGAREILQEVISEGDPEQQAAAESVLSSLD